jgi:succinoglycan biosynthesis transport protein ExoP
MRSLTDWFEVVWFRRKVVAIITAVIVALMAVYLVFAPRTYQASASLYFDKSAPDPLKSENNGQQQDNRLTTEAEVIRSSKVVQRVIQSIPAPERKEYEAKWGSQSKSGQPFEDWLRAKLLSAVTVTTQADTKVLAINAVAPEPENAAELANRFATGYVEAQRELSTGPAQAYAKFLSGNMAAARKDVERAESALSSFVKATGISGDTQASAGALAATVSQLAGSQAAAAGAARMGGSDAQGIADAQNTETVQRLSTDYATKAAQVSQYEATLGPNHPTLQAAEAELATIKARLNAERRSATDAFVRSRQAALAAESAAAAARAGQLQSAANSQRSQLVEMSSNLGKFATLQQDLATAQQRYNELSSRASQMQLRGALPLANVSQLDTAKAPDRPTSPKVGLLSMLAVMMGLAIGAGVAILLEYLNPRVRTLANVEKLIGVPVVARLSLPRETPRMLTDASAN